MGQNNDPGEHGDLQGNQGGLISKNPEEEKRIRQKEESGSRGSEEVLSNTNLNRPAKPRD